MKKIAIVVWLCCLAVWQGWAQEFHFIPKVGLNLANITGLYDMNLRPGVNIGVSGEFMFTPRFALEPGIFYSVHGVKGDIMVNQDDGLPKGGKLVYGPDYLNIPVYAKWYSNVGGLYLFGGPQFSIKVQETNKVEISGGDDIDDLNEGVSSFKAFDLGLGAGLGYQFESGLLLSAGYMIGFLNPIKENTGKTHLNSVFQFNAGWRF